MVNLRYLYTPTGVLNLVEILTLIAALISVAFTSRLYCELADNLQWIYPDLLTSIVRAVFQTFAILCLIITILILAIHLLNTRYVRQNFVLLNQLCLVVNVIMGLMMISIGICAALWEDKLRRTPSILKRGYFFNQYQTVFNEETHPRPGAAAAAAAFALLAGIFFIIEACTRPMLAISVKRSPDRPIYTVAGPIQGSAAVKHSERVIPIETTSQYRI